MKNNKLYIIAALLGVALGGCEKEELYSPNDNPEARTWKLVVQATKDVDSKALAVSGNNLDAYWELEETVNVFYNGDVIGDLAVTAVSQEGNVDVATLSGRISIPDGLSEGSKLYLLFPGRDDEEWNYLNQDGLTSTIASQFDYASAELTVASLDSVNEVVEIQTGRASFTNEQSVYRLAFKIGDDATAVESIMLTANENKLVRNRTFDEGAWQSNYGALHMDPTTAPAGNLYFMSIRNENTSDSNNYIFTAVDRNNDVLYEGIKVINRNLINGKFYNATVNIDKKDLVSSGTISNASEVL